METGNNSVQSASESSTHNSPISSVEHFLDGSVKKIISLSLKRVPGATFNMFKLGGFHFHIQYSTMGLNNSIYFH